MKIEIVHLSAPAILAFVVASCAPPAVDYQPVIDTRATPPGRDYGRDLGECREFAAPVDAAGRFRSAPVQVQIIRRCLAGRGYHVLY